MESMESKELLDGVRYANAKAEERALAEMSRACVLNEAVHTLLEMSTTDRVGWVLRLLVMLADEHLLARLEPELRDRLRRGYW